jgi:APA family basic amino acid/polyamine antiporter
VHSTRYIPVYGPGKARSWPDDGGPKSVEQSIADTDEPDTRLRKDLTWWDLTVFGVSVVIGAGIFTITASTAGNLTGPAISISFVIAAVACGLAALCYAEFASTVPVAGSAYTFSYATFGEFVAWTSAGI